MLVFENGSWQTSTESHDENYLEGCDNVTQPRWVVPDGSAVAAKIMSAARPWTPVEDEDGELIDITETPLTQDELDQQRAEEIKQQLTELDYQAIRPLRAILAGTPADEDRDRLAEIEAQAIALRRELSEPERE